ncbi:MAG: sulfite exporter TauE/SafE family protein [Candidatus Hodarchaeales archaeon]
MFENILNTLLIIGFISLLAALAGTVGIGGGGFFTPILMIIGGLSIFNAVPIASVTIIGVALASTLVNMRNKTINYKLGLILEPATIIGTIIGVQIHLVSPEEIIIFIFSIIMVFLTIKTYLGARRNQKAKFEESDPLSFTSDLSRNRILIGIIGSITAGIISAMIGIGGGLIKVPMMNELGLSPLFASGTGSFMVLFTSISTTVQFLFYQRLDLGVGIIFFIVGFLASIIGTSLSRYNTRPEIIQYFLSLAIGCSTILILVQLLFL